MADLTWAEILTAYAKNDTKVKSITDGAVYLADAEAEIDSSKWGDMYQRGRAHLALHMAFLATSSGRGPAGALTAESLGDMSRSYAAPSLSHVLESTNYGIEFLRLKRQVGRRMGGFLTV